MFVDIVTFKILHAIEKAKTSLPADFRRLLVLMPWGCMPASAGRTLSRKSIARMGLGKRSPIHD